MRSHLGCASPLLFVLLCACSSETSGTSGSSGAGGDGGGPATTGSGTQGTGPSSGTGGTGSGGAPATSSVTTASGGGCDQSGDCGDSESGCVACALAGVCAAEWAECTADPECEAFASCDAACNGDRACEDGCFDDHPDGAQLYITAVVCAVCDGCYVDCDGASKCL